MIPLTGRECRDENGSQYPEIYSRIVDPNSTTPFHQQINAFTWSVRNQGLEPVDRSAYLRNHRIDRTSFYEPYIERIRRHLSIPPELPRLQNDHDMVFIWNIGDITMLTRDHIEELKMLRPDIDSSKLYNLRESICEGVNGLEDSIDIIRKVDNIEDALLGETDEMRRAAPIYDALRELYISIQSNETSNGKKPNISHDLLEKLDMLGQENELSQVVKEHQKVYYNRWKCAKRSLELVNRRSAKSETKKYASVVISEEGVATAAAQLMLAGLSSTIPIENIYSTNTKPGEVDKSIVVHGDPNRFVRTSAVVERIQRRFGGENCALVYVGSGWTFIAMRLIQWRIIANESIEWLIDLQRDLL